MLLSASKARADEYLNEDVKDVVIAIPTWFNPTQRQATRDAGNAAGLNVMRIIDEPTAAVIAQEFKFKDIGKTHILVYDFGSETFYATLAVFEKGSLSIQAVGGDAQLGGNDLDTEIVNYVIKEFKDLTDPPIDINAMKEGKVKAKVFKRIRKECLNAKIILSSAENTDIVVDAILDGEDMDVPLTRAKLEEICGPHFQKTFPIIDKVLKEGGITKDQVDHIVLIGGSTRFPKIQKMLQSYFPGKEIKFRANSDEAVAKGAAILAAQIQGK